MKNSYVNFLNHCYVDTEVEMKEIYTSNHIWTLFEDFLVDMARVRIITFQNTVPVPSQHFWSSALERCVVGTRNSFLEGLQLLHKDFAV